MRPAFLSIEKLRAGYRADAPVLNDVSLEMAQGEALVVLGPSGCGKTTLLRCIAGLERPIAGSIRMEGAPLSDGDVFIAPEMRPIGFVFQGLALFPHLTVKGNVAFGLREVSRSERDERVKEELELVGIADLAGRYPHELSGGQQQRAAIARSLVRRPRLMLMDEPFSDLDPANRARLRTEVMRILREHHASVIMVTHDREDAFHVADRIAEMDRGRIVRNETAAVVRAEWSRHPFEA